MNANQLIDEVCQSVLHAVTCAEQLHDDKEADEPLNKKTVASLLEHARALNSAAQALERLAAGMPEPVVGP